MRHSRNFEWTKKEELPAYLRKDATKLSFLELVNNSSARIKWSHRLDWFAAIESEKHCKKQPVDVPEEPVVYGPLPWALEDQPAKEQEEQKEPDSDVSDEPEKPVVDTKVEQVDASEEKTQRRKKKVKRTGRTGKSTGLVIKKEKAAIVPEAQPKLDPEAKPPITPPPPRPPPHRPPPLPPPPPPPAAGWWVWIGDPSYKY